MTDEHWYEEDVSYHSCFLCRSRANIAANLQYGIQTNSAGSNVNVTTSTIGSNGTGVQATAGNIISFGNNTLNGNATDGYFTSTKAMR